MVVSLLCSRRRYGRLLHRGKSRGLHQFGPFGIAIRSQRQQVGIVVPSQRAVACRFSRAGGAVDAAKPVGVALQRALELDLCLLRLPGGQQHFAQQLPRRYNVSGGHRVLVGRLLGVRGSAHQLQRLAVSLLSQGDPRVERLDLEICLAGPVADLGRGHRVLQRLQALKVRPRRRHIADARRAQAACVDQDGFGLRKLVPRQINPD